MDNELVISKYNAYGFVSLKDWKLSLVLFSGDHRFDFEHNSVKAKGSFLAAVLFNVGKPEPFTFDVALFGGDKESFEQVSIRDYLITDAAVMEAEIST